MNAMEAAGSETKAKTGAHETRSGVLARMPVVRKVALAATIVVTIGIAGLVAIGIYGERTTLLEQGEKGFLAITHLLAENVSGGLRWGRSDAVEEAYLGFAQAEDSLITSLATLTRDGEILTEYASGRGEGFDLLAYLEANVPLESQDETSLSRVDGHVVVVVPAGADDSGARYGTLAVAWSLASLEQEVASAFVKEMIVGLLSLAAIIGVLIVAGQALIGRPLVMVTDAMRRLAEADTSVDIPATHRSDDIGAMARMLEVFKVNAIEKARIEVQSEETREQFEAKREAQEKIIETLMGEVVSAAVAGDLSTRIDTGELSGVMERLSEGVNTLLDTVELGLTETVDVMSALAEGDLTRRMAGEYQGSFLQLKRDANRMAEQIASIAGGITESTNAVKGATAEIAAGAADLSSRTEQQASSLEETSASMEELSATVRQNADNAQQANQLAAVARDAAAGGGQVVSSAVEAMGQIENSSQRITEIVGMIDEIAFQTNLLALNAAVEAARAGEAGKGFAVVATEVRALAQRSGQASKEIKELILTSDGQVREGVGLVKKAGESLEEIVTSVKSVADIVSDIAAASQEQSSGIDEVSSAVTNMDEMTQQNAALVEETTAALHSAQSQVEDLEQLVGFFNTGNERGGQKATVAAAAVAAGPNPVHEQRRVAAK